MITSYHQSVKRKPKAKTGKGLVRAAELSSKQCLENFLKIKTEASGIQKKSRKKISQGTKKTKTYTTPKDISTIRKFESYFKVTPVMQINPVKPKDSFFDGKKDELERNLIFTAEKKQECAKISVYVTGPSRSTLTSSIKAQVCDVRLRLHRPRPPCETRSFFTNIICYRN